MQLSKTYTSARPSESDVLTTAKIDAGVSCGGVNTSVSRYNTNPTYPLKEWYTTNNTTGSFGNCYLYWKFPIRNGTLYIGHKQYQDSCQIVFHTGARGTATSPDDGTSKRNYDAAYWYNPDQGRYRNSLRTALGIGNCPTYDNYYQDTNYGETCWLEKSSTGEKPWLIATRIKKFTNDSSSTNYGTLYLYLDLYNNQHGYGVVIYYIVGYNEDYVYCKGQSGYNTDNYIEFSGDYIKFKGIGEFNTSVKADAVDFSKYNYYVQVNGKTQIPIGASVTRDIIVDPYNYAYTKSGNNYTVTVATSGCTLKTPTLLDTSTMYQFSSIPTSYDHAKVVNFQTYTGSGTPTVDKPSTTTNDISFVNGGMTYDSTISACKLGTTATKLYTTSLRGPFLFMIDEIENYDYPTFYATRTDSYTSTSFFTGGLGMRYTSTMPNYSPRNSGYTYLSINKYNSATPYSDAKADLAWFGLPMNCALYWGASGNSAHTYQWQSNTGGSVIRYDQDAACAQVTTDACSKLKREWPNMRVYVIKYRKQTSHMGDYFYNGSSTTRSTISDSSSYGYLDSCASTGSNGKAYSYDITSEAQLKSTLQTIADDIKSFAGYEEAKNVDKED